LITDWSPCTEAAAVVRAETALIPARTDVAAALAAAAWASTETICAEIDTIFAEAESPADRLALTMSESALCAEFRLLTVAARTESALAAWALTAETSVEVTLPPPAAMAEIRLDRALTTDCRP
jgi:hypothetical protein